MNDETEQPQSTFRDWTKHYEKEQTADRQSLIRVTQGLAQVSGDVGKLATSVEQLAANQKGMFDRLNRPTQWGVFAAFATVIFLVMSLVITEIKGSIYSLQTQQQMDIKRNLDLHMWFRDKLDTINAQDARNEANMLWIMKLEERLNRRIHMEVGAEK
jgi:hypothetical protein